MSNGPVKVSELGAALHILDHLALVQRIVGLSVTARPESVRIRFNTNVASTCVVEIFQYITGITFTDLTPPYLVASRIELFGGARLRHDFEIDGLEQDRRLWFKVTATSADPTDPRAYAIGQFLTLSRTARVSFDELIVWRSGDSDSPGEMLFKGGVYDFETSMMIAGPYRRPHDGRESIHSGAAPITAPFGPPRNIANAPKVVTLWVEGSDEDCPDVPWPWAGICARGEMLPVDSVPGVGHGEEEYYVWASAGDDIALPVTPGGYSIAFKLDSGNWGVAFWMSGHIDGEVKPARYAVPPAVSFTIPAYYKKVGKTTMREPGQVAGVGDADGQFELLTIAPDRSLHRRHMGGDEPHHGRRWLSVGGRIAGPVTAIERDGDVHVFATTPDRSVTVASWPMHAVGVPEWRDLGGRFDGDVTPLARGDGKVDLFAVADDGHVHYRIVDNQAHDRHPEAWIDLGGRVKPPIAAHATDGAVHICAVGVDGAVYHSTFSANDPRPRADWQSIGGRFAGPIVIVPRDGSQFVLFAFNQDRTAHAKTWDGHAWRPSAPEWEAIGVIDDVGQEPAMQLGTAAQTQTLG